MTMEPTIVHRFAQIARRYSDLDAIRDSVTTITYGSLDESANGIARALVNHGIGPGERVGLYFDRDPEAPAALLGALMSGAVAVPLLASHPPERLRQIVGDAEMSVIVTGQGRGPAARALGVPILVADPASAASVDVPLPMPEADGPAIILYTSGSTGRPKGVLTTHGLLLQKFDRANAVLQIRNGDRMTFFSTFALGQGVNNILMAFLSGATLCPFDIRREGLARLTSWMAEQRLTIYLSSATLLRNLMRTLEDGREFPDLRILRIGGERVLPSDIVSAHRVFPRAQVIVNYACTETGPVTMHATDREETFPDGIVPIGRPVDGIAVRIVDEAGSEVAQGDEGEIVVQSSGISPRYWRNPEQSGATFKTVPGGAGDWRYHTGDLGRVRSDGRLEHLGRKDLRVKIRGFRVEIEEIESVLNQLPDIVRAAVAAKPDVEGDLRLVAYVQLPKQSDVTRDTLRGQIALRLPEYMIPTAFVFLDEIPTTESGKVARQRLPDPPAQLPAVSPESVMPRSALEETIASIWREILGLETVGVHDAFLSIGGDSLKATLVVSRLSSRIGVEVPLWALFEASTISELANAVERQTWTPPRPALSAQHPG